MNTQIKHFDGMYEIDLAGEYQADLDAAREDAKQAIIQQVLACDYVYIGKVKWTLEELLEAFLEPSNRELDAYIASEIETSQQYD